MVIPQICLCTVTSSFQQFHIFSQFSLIVLMMPHLFPIGITHEVLALAREGLRQRAIAGRVVLTRATVNCILWRHAATVTLVPGKSSEEHTSSGPCFVENDPTGSLHTCSDLDDTDEEFAWSGGSPENNQQPALVPWLPSLKTHNEAPVHGQPPLPPPEVGAEVAESDKGPLAPCHLRWRDSNFTWEMAGLWYVVYMMSASSKRCQVYRVQTGGG